MRMALPLFALCLIGIATTANANDYAQAKAQADRDEASLPRITAEAMHAAQQRAVDTVIERCAAPDADTTAFTVVAELEASGKIMQTWREGDTPLSRCFERELRMLTLAAPPSSPFHIAFEISFTP